MSKQTAVSSPEQTTAAVKQLIEAAERSRRWFTNHVAGRYNADQEDILCGRALTDALYALKEQR